MAVSFIVGRAGSGKTYRCLAGMAQTARESQALPRSNILLIVPEQATFQMERAMHSGEHQVPFAQVMSFRRLAWRVFSEVGGPGKKPIDEVGKRMVLRAITQRHRDRLSLFSKTAVRPGFIETVAQAIKELATYEICPEDLARIAKRDDLGSFLSRKTADLEVIYREYSSFLETAFTDPDRLLLLLAENIKHSAMCKGSYIWIDGFNGFTPQEMTVITSLAKVASSVAISLPLDPSLLRDLSPEGLFAPTIKAYTKLRDLMEKSGLPIDHTLVIPGGKRLPRFDSPELNHLEREFGKVEPVAWPETTKDISVAGLPGKTAEAMYVASRIKELARDHGFRWNDVAVLVHDLNAYRQTIETVFSKHGIPAFIDSRRPVTYHPLVEAVRALLEILTSDFPTDSVVRLCKTDLVPCERDDIDRLENLALSRGVMGSMWRNSEKWLGMEDNPEVAASRRVLSALIPVFEAFLMVKGRSTLAAAIDAIEAVLSAFGAEETLQDWAAEALARGEVEEASIHRQVLDGITSVLAQARETLGNETPSPEQTRHIIETGLATLSLGMVPPSLDQVVVGSLDRSRHPRIRAAFILGLTEGGLPGVIGEDPLFTDQERDRLLLLGITLAPSGNVKAMEQDFQTYTALTRASEKLVLTRPMVDDMGKPLTESPVLKRLRRIFPGLSESFPGPEAIVESISGPYSALCALARLEALSEEPEHVQTKRALRRWFEESGRSTELAFLDAAHRPNIEAPLSPGCSQAVFGDRIDMSVSRLESFKACPFQHFAGHGLRLLERKVGKVDPAIAGIFMHSAMSHLIEGDGHNYLDMSDLSEEEVLALADKASQAAEAELAGEILLDSPRIKAEIEELRQVVRGAALTVLEHHRRGQFRPVATEALFGPAGPLAVPEISTSGGIRVQLKGRIDLVECASVSGKTYFRVIDYKSRRRQIRKDDVKEGVDLQLIGYAHVLAEYGEEIFGGKAEPAGVLYFPLRENFSRYEETPDAEAIELLRLERRKMSGLLTSNAEALRLMDTFEDRRSPLVPVSFNNDGSVRKSRSILDPEEIEELSSTFFDILCDSAERISSGEVAISPYRSGAETACGTCPYSPVCAFDRSRKENKYRLPGPHLSGRHISPAGEVGGKS